MLCSSYLYSHPYTTTTHCTGVQYIYTVRCNQYSIIYTATHTTTINTALHVVYQNITVLAETSANDDTSIYVCISLQLQLRVCTNATNYCKFFACYVLGTTIFYCI